MDMLAKKLVDKASLKKTAVPGNSDAGGDGCSSSANVRPRLVSHHGIPTGACAIAYESSQHIVAISTSDGRIKLFGKDNTQVTVESSSTASSKFLQFVPNKGALLNVTSTNHIEVWDLEKLTCSDVFVLKGEITAFASFLQGECIYVGDSSGSVSVLKLNLATLSITPMKYTIPFSATRANLPERSLVCILPQPRVENKRVLLIFSDGYIALWDVREGVVVHSVGVSLNHTHLAESKNVTSGCWVCPFGSKVSVGYSNGELLIYSIPARHELSSPLSTPITKLNLGYRSDKIPICSLKWLHAEGKASRLYISGSSEHSSANNFQAVLLNDQTETRLIKLGLQLSTPCVAMEIIENDSNVELLVLIGKSGSVYAYNDRSIERYLLQSQGRNSPTFPKEVQLNMLHAESFITASQLITNNATLLNLGEQDYELMAKSMPSLFSWDRKAKETGTAHFPGFRNVRKLFITGHNNGGIRFWDVSCSILLPILSLKHQSEENSSLGSLPVTAIHFDVENLELISGDSSGIVRVQKLKYTSESTFTSFSGLSKRGNSVTVQGLQIIKVNGSVVSLAVTPSSEYLAIGSDHGYVVVYDVKGSTVIYQSQIVSDVSSGIISLQFKTCNFHGISKKVLLVASRDSSVYSLDASNGSMLSPFSVHPKKASKALYMQIIDGSINKKSFVLICSEKAAYIYSLDHCLQGVKKVYHKKKFQSSSCCWASTCASGNDIFLVLILLSGKIEIRSLPDLSLISDLTIRGFACSQSAPRCSVTSSRDGSIIMVNGDQEVFFVSIVSQSEQFRKLDALRQVYKKDQARAEEEKERSSSPMKKKNVLSSMIRRSKEKKSSLGESDGAAESLEKEWNVFSVFNYPETDHSKEIFVTEDVDNELTIDDIELDDPKDNVRQQKPHSKGKLAKKFSSLKGKMKQIKLTIEKSTVETSDQNEKGGSVDEIKKKYGYNQFSENTTAAVAAKSKLEENVRKLQILNEKTAIMQDSARSFSSMAKDLLHAVERGNS